MIGNPSLNPGIWQLYKRYISEKGKVFTSRKKEDGYGGFKLTASST